MNKKHVIVTYLILAVILILIFIGLNETKSNKQEMIALDNNISNLMDSQTGLNEKIRTMESSVSDIADTVDILELNDLATQISIICSDLAKLDTSLTEIGSLADTVPSDVSKSIASIIDTLESNLQSYESEFSNIILTLNSDIDGINYAFEEVLQTNSTAIASATNDFQLLVEDFKSQISNLDELAASSLSSVQEQNTKLVASLSASVSELDKRFSEFGSYINSITQNEGSAEKAFEMASDPTIGTEQRQYSYLNAIYHNPTKPEYYTAYIDFLDSISADPEDYMNVVSVLDSAMLQMDSSSIPMLLPIYDELTVSMKDDNISGVDYIGIWNSARKAFFDYGLEDSKDIGVLTDYYNQATQAYSYLIDPTEEDISSYSDINEIYSMYSLYETVDTIYSNLNDLDDDSYVSSYPITSQVVSSSIMNFSMYENSYLNFSDDINVLYVNMLNVSTEMAERYDSVRAEDVISKMNELKKDVNEITSDTVDEIVAEYNKIQLEVTSFISSAVSESAFEYINSMQNLLGDIQEGIYTQQFVDYQVWASNILNKAAAVKDDYNKEYRLQALYRMDFFDINRGLLIPELANVYDSIDWKSMVSQSRYSAEHLITTFKPVIKNIGEV